MKKILNLSLVLSTLSFLACSKPVSEPYVDENGVTYVKGYFYNYECPSATVCTATANIYIVHADGIDVEVEEEFADKCISQKESGQSANKYCKDLRQPGDSRTFKTGEKAMKHILEYDMNPVPGESLTNRRKSLVEKIKLAD